MYWLILLSVLPLPEDCRAKNIGPNCRWACIDTAVKLNKISCLRSKYRERWLITNGKIGAATNEAVAEWIKDSNYVFDTDHNYDLLAKYAETHGVVISFKAGTPGLGFHTVFLIGYGEYCYFYDSNDGIVKERKLSFIKEWWWGDSLILLGDK
jgi:hypothetical protein